MTVRQHEWVQAEPTFRILGPVQMERDGVRVELGGRQPRSVLAILLLDANRPVSTDRLKQGLWGDHWPDGAANALQAFVSRLRRALAASAQQEPATIVTVPGGYRLQVASESVDLHRFTNLVDAARAARSSGDRDRAAALLVDALALWAGDPLGDVCDDAFVRGERARLLELRLAALVEFFANELDCGRHAEIVGELDALTRQHPSHERLIEMMMLALYRCDRQTDALAAYESHRRALNDKFGLTPAPALQKLQLAILVHDDGLGEATRASPAAPSSQPRHGRDRRSVLIAAGVVMTAILAAVIVVASLGTSARSAAHTTARLGAGSVVGLLTAGGGGPVVTAPLNGEPSDVATGDGAAWVTSTLANTLTRVGADGSSDTISVGKAPIGVAACCGDVWVADSGDGTLDRVSTATRRVIQRIHVGNGPDGVAVGMGSVWVTSTLDGTVVRVDPTSGRVMRTYKADPAPADVAVGAGALWVANETTATVDRIDPVTGGVTPIRVGNGPSELTAAGGALWVVNSIDRTVSRIDEQRGVVTFTRAVAGTPVDVAPAARDGVWVAVDGPDRVVRMETASNAVSLTVPLANQPQAVAAGGAGRPWVAATAPRSSHVGGVLRLAVVGGLDLDPAIGYAAGDWAVEAITNDALLAYRRAGGPLGETVVPDLATAIPSPSDDGRSYTFHLRPGVRYSTGATVRPEDVRYAIERDFEGGSPGSTYYTAIVGATDCAPGHRCDLSRGIAVSDATNTVTFHLTHPDPEFIEELALPFADVVPTGWALPRPEPADRPTPATGPYEIERYTSHSIVLVRNRRFRQWSTLAQPDGYVDGIVIRGGLSTEQIRRAVLHGRYDIAPDLAVPDLRRLRLEHPAAVRIDPGFETSFFALNTRVVPFTSVLVRRAVAYAIDRKAAQITTGEVSSSTCQILPPNLPGYTPYCPFARSQGGRSRGRLRLARRLVARSGVKHAHIVLRAPRPSTDIGPQYRMLRRILQSLGFPTTIDWLPVSRWARGLTNPDSHVPALVIGWVADYPSPSTFLWALFSCRALKLHSDGNRNLSEYCNAAADRLMRRARALETTQPARAAQIWARVDRLITRSGAAVAYANTANMSIVGPRLGDYESDPQLGGPLLDQLWIR